MHVMGALMWSLIDNWEWGTFEHRFGVMGVNLTSQERFYKRSLFDIMDYTNARTRRWSNSTQSLRQR